MHADSGEASGEVEAHAGVHSGDYELIGPDLSHQGGAVEVFVARGAAAVVLGEAVVHAGLPGAEIELLLGLAGFFDRGLELAFEVPLSDFPVHGAEQGVVAGVGFAGVVAENVPATLVDTEGGEADGAVAEGVEEELGEIIRSTRFRNPERIVGAGVGVHGFEVEAGVAGVDVGADHVDGGR